VLDRTDVLFDWIDQADPKHAALIMVDLQNDFVHADGWVAQQQVPGFIGDTGIDTVLDRSKALLDAGRRAGVMTVFVRMLGDDKYLSPALYAQYRRNHGHERPPCVMEGTWGADFYGDLRPDGRAKEFVLDKHRYSAFIGTRLDQLLRSNGVQTIVVCGVATTGCVESTIRDGFMLDYYVVIARDACGDYEAVRHANALSKLDLSFGTVVSVADIEQRWAPPTNGAKAPSTAKAASSRAGHPA
jgi:ureidoacrylate peracid hydrolase